jgi:ubiquinone/menaquinone biosynthesis C-methylase UbiE
MTSLSSSIAAAPTVDGNATLAAARRGCRVVSTDYVGALLERGAKRACAERLEIDLHTADAEALPFAADDFVPFLGCRADQRAVNPLNQ